MQPILKRVHLLENSRTTDLHGSSVPLTKGKRDPRNAHLHREKDLGARGL